jgi:hypothetical protein
MMKGINYSPGVNAERNQLFLLGGGFVVIATGLYWFGEAATVSTLFLGLAALALVGAVFYATYGRPVFLLFALFSSLMGRVVSFVILMLMYFLTIVVFGSLLRLVGMNKLERNFSRCRSRASMFLDAPPTDIESFRRQS